MKKESQTNNTRVKQMGKREVDRLLPESLKGRGIKERLTRGKREEGKS